MIRHRSVGCAGRIRIVIVLGCLLLSVFSLPAHRVDAASATGSGVVLADVDYESGKVTAIRVLQSTGNPKLDAAALETFHKWRFKAKTVRHVKIPVTFTLNGIKTDASPQRESSAYQKPEGGIAVDVKGRRHTANEYPNEHAPWNFADRITAVAPNYPFGDRVNRNQGTGLFRVLVNSKTGSVTQVTILVTTGFRSLDTAAITALRRWRWKPGTWTEIEVPVRFVMAGSAPKPPPDAIPLSR